MSKSKKDSTLVYDDNVIINDFMFCGHGHEYCSHCCTDHRYTNNIQLDDDLINDSDALEEAADRPPLSIEGRFFNTGKRIPKSDPRTPGDPIFACEEHRKPDCKTCFDWPKMIRKATGKKDKGRVDDRDVLLGVLSAMGVVLPASTKLSTDALEKKLTSALNFAQEISKFAAKMPIDPADLPEWKGKKVYESIRRSNIQEAMQNFRSMSLGQDSAFPLYENSFIDARQTIMSLGKHFDDGLTSFVCQDKDQQEACCMRILGVYRLDENTPLILLSYASQTAHEPITKTLDFIQAQMKVGHIAQITCTREEQALLRRLLYLNSTKIVPGFKTNLEAYEKNFRLSFIIPVGPLAQVDIGRLTSDPGCTVCGKKTASRCSSCLSVNYCGSECQRAHWKEHKSFCRSVRGGTWRTVTFSDSLVFDGQRLSSNIISHSSLKLQSTRKGAEDGQGPPNIHGDRTFMVKLQRPLGGNGTVVGILVYDRTRSFSGHINRNEQGEPAVHDEMMRYMPMDGALKIYRWAKRVGDYQLSICIDREPSEIPQW